MLSMSLKTHFIISLEPGLSVPDFASQLWRKIFHQSCKTKSEMESLGLRLLYHKLYQNKVHPQGPDGRHEILWQALSYVLRVHILKCAFQAVLFSCT